MDKKNVIHGCILGGAMGDALGYPVEFDRYMGIVHRFGNSGIRDFVVSGRSAEAVVSDDTQMTLFTAEGLLLAAAEDPECFSGTCTALYREPEEKERKVLDMINLAYREWLSTQDYPEPEKIRTKIYPDRRLHRLRAPGNTCLSAMEGQRPLGSDPDVRAYHTVTDPANNSCGCGGVMRVAPVGLVYKDPKEAFYMAAQAAAITHGHPLGYLSSGILGDMISRIVWHREAYAETGLRQVVLDALDDMEALAGKDEMTERQREICRQALDCASEKHTDRRVIEAIGGGWTGHEALAIAIYCALRYENNFRKAMIASVNHSGDSDSTGAILGNILGAWMGKEQIVNVDFDLDQLEMQDIFEDMAERLTAVV